jgi:hypothetical protein
MTVAIASILTIVVLGFILTVRTKDLPALEPVSPFAHLDERKAEIYESLRDAQFEFRVGKLSEDDYQQTKKQLQKELAIVMAEIDRIQGTVTAPAPKKAAIKANPNVCPSCGAQFQQALKFCGECGKPMKVRA